LNFCFEGVFWLLLSEGLFFGLEERKRRNFLWLVVVLGCIILSWYINKSVKDPFIFLLVLFLVGSHCLIRFFESWDYFLKSPYSYFLLGIYLSDKEYIAYKEIQNILQMSDSGSVICFYDSEEAQKVGVLSFYDINNFNQICKVGISMEVVSRLVSKMEILRVS
jgi:hypothetical protein